MVVVPAGEFMMGSPADERDRYDNEDPLHRVAIARPFAVSKFEVTFDAVGCLRRRRRLRACGLTAIWDGGSSPSSM